MVYFMRQSLCREPNKVYILNESDDAQKLIKFTGARVHQGNVIDHIYPINNIGDLVVAVFKTREETATDLSELIHDSVLLNLQSKTTMRVLIQEIGKQGFEDYADFSSFLDQCAVKHVTNEQGEKMTFFGTFVEVYLLLLNLHGNDPVEKLQFKITYYNRVGQDDPNGGESRWENPRIKCQRVVSL
jgi:hypothetical protein